MIFLITCTNDLLYKLESINKIIDIIRIIIPSILILFCIIRSILLLRKGEKSKIFKTTIISIILSFFIFFLPNIIYYFNDLIGGDNVISCMKNASTSVAVNEMISNAEKTLDENDYQKLEEYYNSIKDYELKNSLKSQVLTIKEAIDIKNSINNLKNNYTNANYNEIKERITNIKNSDIKNKLEKLLDDIIDDVDKKINEIKSLMEKIKQDFNNDNYEKANKLKDEIVNIDEKEKIIEELTILKNYININNSILELTNNYDKNKYNDLKNVIDNIKDEAVKSKLLEKLNQTKETVALNLTGGYTVKNYGSSMKYLEVIPMHPEKDMALMIYLHGDGGFDGLDLGKFIYDGIIPKAKEEFFFIAPTTNAYDSGRRWDNASVIDETKKLIDFVVNEYNIDKNRITIMGHSRGAIGTWDIVSKYPGYFKNAIPVSCRSSAFNAKSFINTRVWAFVGDVGSNEINYNNLMSGYVNNINAIGGSAQLDVMKGYAHGNTVDIFNYLEIYNWALE